MGNTETHGSSGNMLAHFEKRFIISPHPLDPEENHMFYMHERLSNDKYVLRVLTTNDNEEKQKTEELICKKLAMSNKNNELSKSIIPIDHYLFQEDKGYCNSTSKCYMLFNPRNSQPLAYHLARQQYNNTLHKNINEDTVYRGLWNLIEGVALLKFYNQPHRHINCETVYFAKEEDTFVLGDPWISPLTDFHEQYHAPQKLKQMRNQVDKHDPFLADLFSIGMVGLKILGNRNLIDYYSLHKTIDQPGLMQLAKNIKHPQLQALILQLLSDNVQIRNEVLTQTKARTHQLDSSRIAKTRTLSGKVASVRKSFTNNSRAIDKVLNQPKVNITKNEVMQGLPNIQQNLFMKKKQCQPFQKTMTAAYTRLDGFPSDKPVIDIGMPLTSTNFVLSASTPHSNLPFNQFQENLNQRSRQESKLGYLPKETQYLQKKVTFLSKNPPNYIVGIPNFPPAINHFGSNSSLVNSESQKFLKNVSSTPVNFINSQFSHDRINILPPTFSQKRLELKITNNKNHHDEFLTLKNNTTATFDQNFPKKENLNLSEIKISHNSHIFSQVVNAQDACPPKLRLEVLKNQKQDVQPLRTNSSYPTSQSFQNDHFYQKKIYENFKILENKVSQAINSSRLNSSDSRISSCPGLNLQSSSKMIESVIVAKDQQILNHKVAKIVRQQEQHLEVAKDERIVKNECKEGIMQQQQKDGITQQQQRLSPILVRQAQQSQSIQDIKSEEQGSQQIEESVDFLNINTNKSSSGWDQSKQSEGNNLESEEKFQDIVSTPPAKAPSLLRLEGNNLTIPEESDEESVDGQVSRYKGQYVEQMYENGGKYLGYMLNGQRNGNGIFYYKDGGYYDGRWKQNMMNGYGKLYYETGKLAYEGQWYQDQFHGRGTVYNDQPDMVPEEGFDYKNMNESENYWHYYEGDLSHDMKARYGKLMLSNGEFYEGEFKNDQVNGKGQFHRQDGSVVKGMWSEGFFIREI